MGIFVSSRQHLSKEESLIFCIRDSVAVRHITTFMTNPLQTMESLLFRYSRCRSLSKRKPSVIKLKGEPSRRRIMDLLDMYGNRNQHIAVFCWISGTVSYMSTFESRENSTVSTVMLYTALCIDDIMNKAVTTVAKVWNTHEPNILLIFISKERSNMTAPWGAQIRSKKSTYFS